MKALTQIVCVAATLISAAIASAKPYPAGIIALFGTDTVEEPIGDLSDKTAWANPYVDGVRIRTGWNVIQPQKTTYNWATIDQALSLAKQNGKKVGVSIAAGVSTPQWVYDGGATKYGLLDGTGNSMPLPWEPAFQEQWLAFIKMLGERYDGNPALSYICPTGFMQLCIMYLTKTPEDEAKLNALAVQAGYIDLGSAFIPTAEKLIGAFMEAFPTTAVMLNPTIPFATGGMLAQNTVRDWGINTYPGRLGIMYASLRAIPAPHDPSPGALPFPKGFQMICVATDVQRLYGNPMPAYDPPAPTPLQDALENGITLQGQFIEVYGNDLNVTENQSVLTKEAESLKKNLPVKPPTNLRIP